LPSIKKESLTAYLCLAGICVIWGTTFLAMRIGVRSFPPFMFAGIRQVTAGILLSSFLLISRKAALPSFRGMLQQVLASFLMIGLGNGLVTWGEVYVPSGLAAILCSFMPVWVILINLTMNRTELPNVPIVTGVLIGLAGVVLIFSEHLADFALPNYRLGILMILIASLGWAVGSILIKRSTQTNPFMNAGLQMFFGGLWCFLFSLMFDDVRAIQWTASTIYSLTYLTLVGSVAAFGMYVYALTKLPMTIAALYSYVNPVVAVVLGWLVLDEKLNPKIAIAILVTVAGIYLVNRGYQLKNSKRVTP
jgi:drug/metabolite transporter (DMT)-like permease